MVFDDNYENLIFIFFNKYQLFNKRYTKPKPQIKKYNFLLKIHYNIEYPI